MNAVFHACSGVPELGLSGRQFLRRHAKGGNQSCPGSFSLPYRPPPSAVRPRTGVCRKIQQTDQYADRLRGCVQGRQSDRRQESSSCSKKRGRNWEENGKRSSSARRRNSYGRDTIRAASRNSTSGLTAALSATTTPRNSHLARKQGDIGVKQEAKQKLRPRRVEQQRVIHLRRRLSHLGGDDSRESKEDRDARCGTRR